MSDKRTHPNKVCSYLKPKNETLFNGFVAINQVSESEAVNMIMRDFFNRLPEHQRNEFLNKSKPKNSY